MYKREMQGRETDKGRRWDGSERKDKNRHAEGAVSLVGIRC